MSTFFFFCTAEETSTCTFTIVMNYDDEIQSMAPCLQLESQPFVLAPSPHSTTVSDPGVPSPVKTKYQKTNLSLPKSYLLTDAMAVRIGTVATKQKIKRKYVPFIVPWYPCNLNGGVHDRWVSWADPWVHYCCRDRSVHRLDCLRGVHCAVCLYLCGGKQRSLLRPGYTEQPRRPGLPGRT